MLARLLFIIQVFWWVEMKRFFFKKWISSLALPSSQNEEGEAFVDLGQSYRMQMWTSRILLVTCIGLLGTNIFLAVCIMFLVPLKEIQPMFLTTSDKAEQVVRVEPFKVTMPSHRLLSEKMARKYLMKRETVDLQTEDQRYRQVQLLSSPEVFKDFKDFVEVDKSFLKKAKEQNLTRSIVIKSISWISDDKLYIEYEAIDARFGVEIDKRSMIATMTFTYNPLSVTLEDTYLNPVGWIVSHYSLTVKKEGEKNEDI